MHTEPQSYVSNGVRYWTHWIPSIHGMEPINPEAQKRYAERMKTPGLIRRRGPDGARINTCIKS